MPSIVAGVPSGSLSPSVSDAELAAHEADTTSVHGITDTSVLLTTTTAASTYVAKTTTGSAVVGTQTVLRTIDDPTRTESEWSERVFSTTFQDNEDPCWFFGWNSARATSGADNEPALFMGIEADYWESPTNRCMEWYVNYASADGAVNFRPISMKLNRNNNSDYQAQVGINFGSDATGFLSIDSGATQVSKWSSAQFQVMIPATFLNGSLKVDPYSAGNAAGAVLTLSAPTDSVASIQWKRNGTNSWLMYDAASSTSWYLRDGPNAKMHISVSAGAGAGGGSTEFNSAVKIVGNVGFYNTAAAAKPTVTGSRGSNAALASLLTALSGLGLVTDSTS